MGYSEPLGNTGLQQYAIRYSEAGIVAQPETPENPGRSDRFVPDDDRTAGRPLAAFLRRAGRFSVDDSSPFRPKRASQAGARAPPPGPAPAESLGERRFDRVESTLRRFGSARQLYHWNAEHHDKY